MMALRLWLVAILMAAAPLAGAGSASEPDIEDPARDVAVQMGFVNVPAPEIDLLAVWVEPANATTLSTTFRVLDISHRVDADERFSLAVSFTNAEYASASIGVTISPDGVVGGFLGRTHSGNHIVADADVALDPQAGTVRVDIPRDLVTSTMLNAKASGIVTLSGPAGALPSNVGLRDWAPNDLQGRNIPVT